MKKSGIVIFLVGILLIFVIASGCMNLATTEKYTISEDARITHAEYDLTMNCSMYNLLQIAVKHEGFDSVQDALEANITKNLGTGNIAYAETGDTQNNKVTLSFTRTDTYSPPSDSKISIWKNGDTLVYQDNSYNSPELMQAFSSMGSAPAVATPVPTPVPTSVMVYSATSQSYTEIMITPTPVPTKWEWNATSQKYMQVEVTPRPLPVFSAAEEQEMMQSMLSGITVDYYLEMPGKIVNTTATTVNGNKAEWHFGGSSLFNTSIYAESQPPSLLPGFTSFISVIGCALVVLFYGSTRKKSG